VAQYGDLGITAMSRQSGDECQVTWELEYGMIPGPVFALDTVCFAFALWVRPSGHQDGIRKGGVPIVNPVVSWDVCETVDEYSDYLNG
jgi:hypothetical protein